MSQFLNDTTQVYLSFPSRFILSYWRDLLPAWKMPPQTVILFFFKAQDKLNEAEKEQLYQEGCYRINHPQWKTEVYCGMMISRASQAEIKAMLNDFSGVRSPCNNR